MRKFLAYLLIAIASIVGIALLLNFLMAFFVGGRQVVVPDIRGLKEEQAIGILDGAGLKFDKVGEEFSVEYPESTVSKQDPLPGRVVKQGRKVIVVASKGGEFRDVPYCIGKPLRTARIILERSGLVVGNIARVSVLRGYPNEVLSTEPLPGNRVVKGDMVNILVNKGAPEPRILLPDLRDKVYITVKMKLERLGLFVRESSLDKDPAPLRSRVVMQEPPAGFIVSSGDTITLIISSERRERIEL